MEYLSSEINEILKEKKNKEKKDEKDVYQQYNYARFLTEQYYCNKLYYLYFYYL